MYSANPHPSSRNCYKSVSFHPLPFPRTGTNRKAPPGANAVDDFPDAHRYVLCPYILYKVKNADEMPRIEHAYRQSAPDSYGTGLGMMGGNMGGMGINNLPGSQMLLMGRGGYPVG